MTNINALDYFPEDTPAYMEEAWLACLRFSMKKHEIIETFMVENNYRFPLKYD